MHEKREPLYEDRERGCRYGDAREMVTDYLNRFAEDHAGTRGSTDQPLALDDRGYVAVTHEKTTVGINVVESHGILLFLSRLMKVPELEELAFCRRLLELNYLTTSNASFAIDKESNSVYVRAMRQLSCLDYVEFVDILETVADVADEWKLKLSEKTG